jgi:hypothetical protein
VLWLVLVLMRVHGTESLKICLDYGRFVSFSFSVFNCGATYQLEQNCCPQSQANCRHCVDWTNRRYDKAVHSRCLPVELQVLAQRCAQVAQAVVAVPLDGCLRADLPPGEDLPPGDSTTTVVMRLGAQAALQPYSN